MKKDKVLTDFSVSILGSFNHFGTKYEKMILHIYEQKNYNQYQNKKLKKLILDINKQGHGNQCENKALEHIEITGLTSQFSDNQSQNPMVTDIYLPGLTQQGCNNQCFNPSLENLIMPKLESTGNSDNVMIKRELFAPNADLSDWTIYASRSCKITCLGTPKVLRGNWYYTNGKIVNLPNKIILNIAQKFKIR